MMHSHAEHIPLVPGLPPEIVRRLAGQRREVERPGRPVRLRARQPRMIAASEWAPRYRTVTDGAHVGPWRYDYAPHTRKILEIYSSPWVRQVWFCGVDQSGKTNTMLNAMAWAVDCAPGDIFYLMPTELTAQKVVRGKILPMFHASSRLARYSTRRADDEGQLRITMAHGVTIHPAWANSNVSMATYSARYVFGDEVDQFPATGGSATDPIQQILKRLRTYRGLGKAFFGSTPQDKFIFAGAMASPQVWESRLCCPSCGAMVRPEGEHLLLPESADPATLLPDACRVACPACGEAWDETALQQARRCWDWLCVRGADLEKPDRVGFHHRAWDCLDVPLLEIARAWARLRQEDNHAARAAWHHGIEAENCPEQTLAAVSEAGLLRYASELPRGLVPPDTAMLWLLADTQQASFYYQLWACGYGPLHRLHMVRHGQLQTFTEIEALLASDWSDHDGRVFRVAAGYIDSGGTRRDWQKHSRTTEVYEWCEGHRVMSPLKGLPGRAGDLLGYRTLATYPGSRRAIRGGLTLTLARVDLFKDELERLLALEPDDPGALSFHAGIDSAFAAHYTGERKNEAGEWIHARKQRIDYWDCTVYALALRARLRRGIPEKDMAQTLGRRVLSKGLQGDR